MRCAVTGANGFVGRNLVRLLLSNGDVVQGLTRKSPHAQQENSGIKWFQGDLRKNDRQVLRAFLDGTETVFHCAGELNDECAMEALHVAGTERLIDEARGRIQRWVQLSSSGVYGEVRRGVITEDAPLAPRGLYEETKLASEQLVMQAAGEGAFSATVLRPTIIYGEDMPNNSLRAWISAVERGLFFFIGKPGAMANYVHVEDVAKALRRCAEDERAHRRIYNFSAGCRIEAFVAAMCHHLGKPIPSLRLPEFPVRRMAVIGNFIPKFPLSSSRVNALTCRALYSSDRIEHEIGIIPTITAEKGLARLIQAMKMEPYAKPS